MSKEMVFLLFFVGILLIWRLVYGGWAESDARARKIEYTEKIPADSWGLTSYASLAPGELGEFAQAFVDLLESRDGLSAVIFGVDATGFDRETAVSELNELTGSLQRRILQAVKMLAHQPVDETLVNNLKDRIRELDARIRQSDDVILTKMWIETADSLTDQLMDIEGIRTQNRKLEAEVQRAAAVMGAMKSRLVKTSAAYAGRHDEREIERALRDLTAEIKLEEKTTQALLEIARTPQTGEGAQEGKSLYDRERGRWL